MDFFQSHKLCPRLLSYLLPFSRTFNCTSKTTGWFTKGLKLIPTCPQQQGVTQGGTRILIYIDGLLSVAQTVPSRCYLPFFHIPERSIALSDWLVHKKGLKLIQPAYANKVLLKGAHAFLYTLMDFFDSQSCAQTVAILPSSIFERSIALVKRLAGSPKG
jgi:hypothetical protein